MGTQKHAHRRGNIPFIFFLSHFVSKSFLWTSGCKAFPSPGRWVLPEAFRESLSPQGRHSPVTLRRTCPVYTHRQGRLRQRQVSGSLQRAGECTGGAGCDSGELACGRPSHLLHLMKCMVAHVIPGQQGRQESLQFTATLSCTSA